GKTTTAGKLAKWLAKQGRHPLLVSTDVKRPAAIEQLNVVGQKAGARVYDPPGQMDPVARATGAGKEAVTPGFDAGIDDSAGRPLAFAGSGERLEDLEPFHPDRVVSRVLGMGDVLSLIEKAEAAIDEDDAARLEEKIRSNEFTLDDFRDQLKMIRRMGPLESI